MTQKILHHFNKNQFNENLLQWYKENKRDLPWRKTKDPYKIWVSEIMLQQTKVDTVIPYFKNFMTNFPTIYDLAAANEQEVLKMWEGLGYYSRARNLYTAAQEVVTKYNGNIPEDRDLIGNLKGIGPYTRGAILSIAFNQPEPAVDGNVMRVLSRVLLIEDNINEQKVRKKFESIVKEIISTEDPSSFNQGLMEIGALICTPKKPACLLCPIQQHCRAFQNGMAETLPVKLKKKRQKEMDYYVLILRDQSGNVAIHQRPSEGLLANMWQFPMIPKKNIIIDNLIENDYGLQIKLIEKLGTIRHVFSHLIWNLHIYDTKVDNVEELRTHFHLVSKHQLHTYPFSVSHLKVKDLI